MNLPAPSCGELDPKKFSGLVCVGLWLIKNIEKICQQEQADFSGFARPLIAEPDLPNRWLKMGGDTECGCISCNQCLSYLLTGQNLVTCQVL
jgi:2,4-dienoyl-CoA reductase-like NADH-dependent reductase (Old Yellow Enzyme family)